MANCNYFESDKISCLDLTSGIAACKEKKRQEELIDLASDDTK